MIKERSFNVREVIGMLILAIAAAIMVYLSVLGVVIGGCQAAGKGG